MGALPDGLFLRVLLAARKPAQIRTRIRNVTRDKQQSTMTQTSRRSGNNESNNRVKNRYAAPAPATKQLAMDYNSPTGDHGSPDSVRSLPRMEGPSLTRINTHSSQKQPVRSRNMDVEAEPSHPTPHTPHPQINLDCTAFTCHVFCLSRTHGNLTYTPSVAMGGAPPLVDSPADLQNRVPHRIRPHNYTITGVWRGPKPAD